METYFSKFPTIVYNNYNCKDITRSVKIVDQYLRIPNSYYNYELDNETRADTLSYFVYNDSFYDWLIYLTNGIVDPYYSWYMDQSDFNNYINKKYGSMESAIKQTKFYRNAWYNDDREITPSYFNNTLAKDDRKYFTPNFGPNGRIVSYKRNETDWVVNTNRMMFWEINYASGNSFTVGEILDFKYGGDIVGGAEVAFSNSSAIIFQHISGVVNSSVGTIGETSNSQASLISKFKNDVVNITDDEFVYWERVSAYDWEIEQNSSKQYVKLMYPEYALPIAEKLIDKLQEE
jgi:hypothetical protein